MYYPGAPGTMYLENRSNGSTQLVVNNKGQNAPAATVFDNLVTSHSFTVIELRQNGHVNFSDSADSLTLLPNGMIGDNTARLYW